MTRPAILTPSDRILRELVAALRGFDWLAAGCDVVPHIRHARRRFSTPDEYPCITARWEQDEPRVVDQDTGYINPWETFVDMRVTIEIETAPIEDDDDDLDDEDETGLGYSSALAFLALRALKDPEGPFLSMWANSVSDRGRGEDPDSTNDEARFEQSIIVLYRVSTEDPSVLLAVGMNA